jgi:hypothetical protein
MVPVVGLSMVEITHSYILFEKPEAKKSLGRPKRRWENNSETSLLNFVWVGFIRLKNVIQLRANVSTIIKHRFQEKVGKFFEKT